MYRAFLILAVLINLQFLTYTFKTRLIMMKVQENGKNYINLNIAVIMSVNVSNQTSIQISIVLIQVSFQPLCNNYIL